MIKFLNASVISGIVLLSAGCNEAADKAERTYDCVQICDKYADCYDDDLDKTECVDSCEANGDADPDFEEQASDCEECIDGSSCLEATVDCATQCGSVVAESTD